MTRPEEHAPPGCVKVRARSPGAALSLPRSVHRFRGDVCALSSRSWPLEPRLVRVTEAAAPPLLACLPVGPVDGGVETVGADGGQQGDQKASVQ